jgi:nicotinamidase-related amidase
MLLGIEAHVCVLQTTLDLIEKGYEVHLLVDGISSQNVHDREVALHRLAQSGGYEYAMCVCSAMLG